MKSIFIKIKSYLPAIFIGLIDYSMDTMEDMERINNFSYHPSDEKH